MKCKIFLLFILFFFMALFFIQAEEPNNTDEINRINAFVFNNPLSDTIVAGRMTDTESKITDVQARSLISQFLTATFNRHIRATQLRITEISFTTDWNKSTDEMIYLNIGARFTNFPINKRILNGRLETQLAMRTPQNRRILPDRSWRIENSDNSGLNIKLLVDDQLTNDHRRTMTAEYIRSNYNNPIDIQIHDDRTEIYGNVVFSYVSTVVNNDTIVFLRVIFDKQPPQIENIAIFTIEGSNWLTNRAEVIFEEKFPNINNSTIKELNNKMFGQMSDFHSRTIGGKTYLERSSGTRSIGSVTLKSASNQIIKLELNTIYRLDYKGWFGSYKDYSVLINAYYKFDLNNGEWIFMSMEDIEDSNIRAL